VLASLVDRETPSELPQEAVPVAVPLEELHPSISEDEELAKLGCPLEIDVGEALGMGLTKVQRRWFSISNNMVAALESWEVIERGDGAELLHIEQPVVGYWGNVIDPLNTTWVHPDGTPYAHDEVSVPRGEGCPTNSLDTEFEEGGHYDPWAVI
jgi:hypothetical protein